VERRLPVEVLCTEAEGGVLGAEDAFRRLEARLPTLRGRRFFGVLAPDGTYRACVGRRPEDDPGGMSLWTIPGGPYARCTMRNWRDRTDEIGPTFDAIAARTRADPERPSVEWYRSERSLVLLLPVLEDAR